MRLCLSASGHSVSAQSALKISAFTLALCTLALSGCGRPPKLGGKSVAAADVKVNPLVPKPTPEPAPTKDDDVVGVPPVGPSVIKKKVSDSGTGFQVKSIDLLRNSITSCVGANLTKVSCDMIIGSSAGAGCAAAGTLSANGKNSFLGATYRAGSDVIDAEAGNLYDSKASSRAGTGADQLTDVYLRSLAVIGDVVAHNCDTSNGCDCSSPAKAAAMVQRCIPQLDPASTAVVELSGVLAGACSSSDAAKRRKAVASMLSSYAFASAR